jgi:molecular chaperone GrpE (heat shock protein)
VKEKRMDSDSRVWDRIEILERSLFLLEKKVSDWLEQSKHNSDRENGQQEKTHELLTQLQQQIKASQRTQKEAINDSLGGLEQRLANLEKQQELGNRLASMEAQLQEKIETELQRFNKTLQQWVTHSEKQNAAMQKGVDLLEQAKNRYREEQQELEGLTSETVRQRELQMAEEMLPVLDAIDQGFTGANQMSQVAWLTWLGGAEVSMTLQQMNLARQRILHWLALLGVEPIPTTGICDAKFHRVVAYEPGQDNHIIREMNKGYKSAERVLRYAEVVVGKREVQ